MMCTSQVKSILNRYKSNPSKLSNLIKLEVDNLFEPLYKKTIIDCNEPIMLDLNEYKVQEDIQILAANIPMSIYKNILNKLLVSSSIPPAFNSTIRKLISSLE